MTEYPESVPIWGWYLLKTHPTAPFRAMKMTHDFSYTDETGTRRGKAGEWLVEDREGRFPKAFRDDVFHAAYVACEPERPKLVTPPHPAPPFEGPPVDPDKEAI